jgi:hypothetical protein
MLLQTGLKGPRAMFSQVGSQLRNRAAWLMAGQYDRIVAAYHFPMLVQLDSSRLVVRTPEEATAMLRLQRAAFAERGVVALKPCVTAMDLPRGGRFRIWVDWQELSLTEQSTPPSSAVYYCRQTPAGFRIEMVDYTRLSMPELRPHFAALALSA